MPGIIEARNPARHHWTMSYPTDPHLLHEVAQNLWNQLPTFALALHTYLPRTGRASPKFTTGRSAARRLAEAPSFPNIRLVALFFFAIPSACPTRGKLRGTYPGVHALWAGVAGPYPHGNGCGAAERSLGSSGALRRL